MSVQVAGSDFFHTGSGVKNSGSVAKNFSHLSQKIVSKLPDPDPDYFYP